MSVRVIIRIGVALCLFSSMVGTAVGDQRDRAAAATQAALIQGKKPMGISYGDTLPFLSPAVLNHTLDDAVALGVRWVRADLAWDDIQTNGPSDWQWSNFDRVVAAAAARKLHVLPILAYTPAWARPPGSSSDKAAPASPNQFAAFARAAAHRYASLGVHSWEIWNEPNVVTFWQPAPDPAAYVALVQLAAAAIRSVDADARVISGGLAPTATSGGDISQLDFLTAFCARGGLQYVDAVGYHPYSFPVPPGYDAPWNAWAQIATTTPSFKSVLASYGASGKKIWLTEYGAPTNGPGVGATVANYQLNQSPDHVDEALQAEMATDSVALATSTAVVGGLFWYSYQDLGTDPSTPENFYGLRRFDGSEKPAYGAFQAAIASAQTSPTASPYHRNRLS
jgi:polysaccharide biosynthesis protein PslG